VSIEITRAAEIAGGDERVTSDALAFVEQLHRRFEERRRAALLAARRAKRDIPACELLE
jgi:malate synthase